MKHRQIQEQKGGSPRLHLVTIPLQHIHIYIMRIAVEEQDGIKIQGQQTSNLCYADDTVLLKKSEEDLQKLLSSGKSPKTMAYNLTL